ncbi:MAG TPA: NAD(P)/FAD-dependent oxidoreductase, partial [Burkholderiales bacterium]|nr:NAD(P)/FAD-dependent oxidoreductase [Burkholderiales bacterium]
NVTLIEPDKQFLTCPFSNYVLAGFRTMQAITQNYNALRKRGVQVIHDRATALDPNARKISLKGGKTVVYDRLVVSPGVDIKWGAIKNYTDVAAVAMPHAWKAGPQTTLLRKQLVGMKNGGTFVMVAPANPFRCPPGPYERASVVAHYFKQAKPKSKVLILDSKDAFSKQGLFVEGWQKLYGNMIEWVPGSKGGMVTAINTRKMTVETEVGVVHKGDVINVISPQQAGRIAIASGLTDDKGWCPVNPLTFESAKHKNIYVIGDAAIAGTMPKSGFSANSQAKTAAAAIIADLNGRTPSEPTYVNTCYSLLAPDYGISVAGVYRAGADGIKEIPASGGVSPKDADAAFRAAEAKYAFGWYASITADIWS